MKQKILVYDLETNSVDTNTAIPRIMGFYSSEVDGFKWTTDIGQMVHIINSHDVLVGYNHINFDNEIMKRFGANTFYKVNVDCMKVIHGDKNVGDKGWINAMSLPDGSQLSKTLHSASMAATAKALGAPHKIEDFDYSVFKKPFSVLSNDEKSMVKEYLKRDLDTTLYIYEWLENYFKDNRDGGIEINGQYKPFLKPEQIKKKQYMTCSVASYAYKVICNLTGLPEEYGNAPRQNYDGGFVALPEFESAAGNIYCLDYSSLYPHIMIMMNLYGASSHGKQGEGLALTKGKYDNKVLSRVSDVLKQLYDTRLEYKKVKDGRQYTIKIIINTFYGLLGNPVFKSVSDYLAAEDCTKVGQQFIKAARLHFKEHGYKVLYTDTDSVYIQDPFNDKEKMLRIKDKHIRDIKSCVHFPVDTFDMTIDAEIDLIHFFLKSNGNFLKKHYLYVKREKDGSKSLQIVGMQIVKSDCTPLAKHIFNKYIRQRIIDDHIVKHTRSQIESWIYQELREDLTLATKFFKVKDYETYKSKSCVPAQIARDARYGPGEHKMWKMKQSHARGAGTNQNYVSTKFIDEIDIGMIDLSKTLKELNPFIKPVQRMLTDF